MVTTSCRVKIWLGETRPSQCCREKSGTPRPALHATECLPAPSLTGTPSPLCNTATLSLSGATALGARAYGRPLPFRRKQQLKG